MFTKLFNSRGCSAEINNSTITMYNRMFSNLQKKNHLYTLHYLYNLLIKCGIFSKKNPNLILLKNTFNLDIDF